MVPTSGCKGIGADVPLFHSLETLESTPNRSQHSMERRALHFEELCLGSCVSYPELMEVDAQLHERRQIDAIFLALYHKVFLSCLCCTMLAVRPLQLDQAGVVSFDVKTQRNCCLQV